MDTQNHGGQRIDAITRASNHPEQHCLYCRSYSEP
jgi:hypothetical protein